MYTTLISKLKIKKGGKRVWILQPDYLALFLNMVFINCVTVRKLLYLPEFSSGSKNNKPHRVVVRIELTHIKL